MVGDTTAYDGIASGFHYHKDKGTMVLLQLSGWQKGSSVLRGKGARRKRMAIRMKGTLIIAMTKFIFE